MQIANEVSKIAWLLYIPDVNFTAFLHAVIDKNIYLNEHSRSPAVSYFCSCIEWAIINTHNVLHRRHCYAEIPDIYFFINRTSERKKKTEMKSVDIGRNKECCSF